jgi:diketogulonate reductase-like aldo/keto reductase
LGAALKEIEVPREDLFITTKVLSNVANPKKALETSLKKIGVDYVDLYLIHAPFDIEIEKAWQVLEELKDQGIFVRI